MTARKNAATHVQIWFQYYHHVGRVVLSSLVYFSILGKWLQLSGYPSHFSEYSDHCIDCQSVYES